MQCLVVKYIPIMLIITSLENLKSIVVWNYLSLSACTWCWSSSRRREDRWTIAVAHVSPTTCKPWLQRRTILRANPSELCVCVSVCLHYKRQLLGLLGTHIAARGKCILICEWVYMHPFIQLFDSLHKYKASIIQAVSKMFIFLLSYSQVCAILHQSQPHDQKLHMYTPNRIRSTTLYSTNQGVRRIDNFQKFNFPVSIIQALHRIRLYVLMRRCIEYKIPKESSQLAMRM